jgi:hypothetical protein
MSECVSSILSILNELNKMICEQRGEYNIILFNSFNKFSDESYEYDIIVFSSIHNYIK